MLCAQKKISVPPFYLNLLISLHCFRAPVPMTSNLSLAQNSTIYEKRKCIQCGKKKATSEFKLLFLFFVTLQSKVSHRFSESLNVISFAIATSYFHACLQGEKEEQYRKNVKENHDVSCTLLRDFMMNFVKLIFCILCYSFYIWERSETKNCIKRQKNPVEFEHTA